MSLKLLEESDIQPLINLRDGEEKIGQHLLIGSQLQLDELENINAQYVVFGVPEDAGPRANQGKPGAESGWDAILPAFLNIQENQYLSGKSILMLGILDFRNDPHYNSNDVDELRKLVDKIDQAVAETVEMIVKAGKTPILIGGGHNNSYGLLKGASKAIGKSINCINLDPHADFRALEGRHSGNGFSYAKDQGYLNKYFICGLHQNYNSNALFQSLDESDDISYSTFDHCIIQGRNSFRETMKKSIAFVSSDPFGLEIDCDSIQHFPVSAKTPSGLSANQARMFCYQAAAQKNAIYFHLAEAAPSLDNKNEAVWGKLMAYLVSDFIKAKSSMH